MNHKKHNIEDDDNITIWKNQKYFIPTTPNLTQTNDFNYSNIQLPTLDEFFRPLLSSSNARTPNQGGTTYVGVQGITGDGLLSKDIEPLTTIETEQTEQTEQTGTTDSLSSSETLSTTKYNNFVDYEFTKPDVNFDIGLNAKDSRVDIPPMLPDEVEIPEELPDVDSVRNVDTQDIDDAKDTGNKLKRSISAKWKIFYRSKTLKNAKKLAVSVVENVPEMFGIPETISKIIVKNATDKSKRKSIDYAQNMLKVNSHFKSFIAILLCLYITFNWWYLILYTNHYIDFYKMLELPMFTPMIWIIGPLTTPLAALNYYLLGKRTEPEFYKKYIEPILKNKSFYLSMLFIVTVVLYEPIIQLFTTNMKDILGESDKMNPLVGIVIATAVLSFFYSVVFNTERNIQFIGTVSFLVAIVSYLIMFILVIMLAKPVSMLVILYVVFYSFLFLLFSENVNFVGKIMEMMSDTTEQCLNNSAPSTFSKLMNVCYRYSFFILVFIVLFVRILHALYDARSITEERVRVSCYAIYLSLLIVFMLLMGYNFIDVMMNVKQIITGEGKGDIPDEDEFDKDDPDISLFGKIINSISSFGEQLWVSVLILWEALKYIVIQLTGLLTFPFRFLYKQSSNIISSLNPFGTSSSATTNNAGPLPPQNPTPPVVEEVSVRTPE
jgi:hypothetical protein